MDAEQFLDDGDMPPQGSPLLRDVEVAECLRLLACLDDGNPQPPEVQAEAQGALMSMAIPGQVLSEFLHRTARDPTSLALGGLTIIGAEIRGDLHLVGLDWPRSLRLVACRITHFLRMHGTRLDSLELDSSQADHLAIENSHLARGLVLPPTADGIGLFDVGIGGDVRFDRQRFPGADELKPTEVTLDRVAVGGDLVVEGVRSFIGLRSVSVAQAFRLECTLEDPDLQPSFNASRLEVGDDLVIDPEFVDVARSAILLSLAETTANSVHIAAPVYRHAEVYLGGVRCDRLVMAGESRFARSRFQSVGPHPPGGIALPRAEVGLLVTPRDPGDLPPLRSARGWKLGGVLGVVADDVRVAGAWLTALPEGVSVDEDVSHEEGPSSQVWSELANAYETMGQASDARRIRYRWAGLAAQMGPLPSRVVQVIYRITTGYGHYPLRSLAWLLGVFLVALGLIAVTGDDFTTETTAAIAAHEYPGATIADIPGRVRAADCTNPSWDTPCMNTLEYAASVAIPPAIATPAWLPPPGPVSLVMHTLRVLSWVFVGFLLAGLTGLLRRQ